LTIGHSNTNKFCIGSILGPSIYISKSRISEILKLSDLDNYLYPHPYPVPNSIPYPYPYPYPKISESEYLYPLKSGFRSEYLWIISDSIVTLPQAHGWFSWQDIARHNWKKEAILSDNLCNILYKFKSF
jgi:hypothetical protein